MGVLMWIAGLALALSLVPWVLTAVWAALSLPFAMGAKLYEAVTGKPVSDEGSLWRGKNSMATQHPYSIAFLAVAGVLIVVFARALLIQAFG